MYLNLYFSLILPILVVKGKNSTRLKIFKFKKKKCWHLLFLRLNEGYYDDDFNWILRDLGNRLLPEANCLTFMTDKFYDYSLNNMVLDDFKTVPLFKIRVKDYEDLLSPNYKTVSVIKEARAKGCNTYIILIANGEQVARFLKFGDKHRVIDTRVKYLMLYDSRIFIKELNYIWKKIVNVLFIRKLPGSLRYELSTVPFPKPIRGKLTPMRLDSWRAGKFQKSKDLFVDKTSNLRNETLRAATFEHMPSTTKVPLLKNTAMSSGFLVQGTEESPLIYSGLEIQILSSLSEVMNFKAIVYEPDSVFTDAWGVRQPNGSYSGLLGEIKEGKADLVLGNMLYSPHNLRFLDLSRPYTTECFTFLTPESTTDNSWKTLIAPFRIYMWTTLFITLVIGSLVFFGLAKFHTRLENVMSLTSTNVFWKDMTILWQKKQQNEEIKVKPFLSGAIENAPVGLYLFSNLGDSLMNTYSMLLLVSLPKMPTGWSLRMMTGWWYLYCLLVTVAYRASMTAILASPAQKVTIDTLNELAMSLITCGGWGEQNKELFTTSLDSAGQLVGKKFEVTYDADKAISRVADGNFAYFENVYFLHYSKVKQKIASSLHNNTGATFEEKNRMNKDLHIMQDCAVNLPVSLGLQKNSPLKPKVDVFLQRVIEAGLVKKWLRDVMLPTAVAEAPLNKMAVKALMDLKKFQGALVALGIGYAISLATLCVEIILWYGFIVKNPMYDKYFKGRDLKQTNTKK